MQAFWNIPWNSEPGPQNWELSEGFESGYQRDNRVFSLGQQFSFPVLKLFLSVFSGKVFYLEILRYKDCKDYISLTNNRRVVLKCQSVGRLRKYYLFFDNNPSRQTSFCSNYTNFWYPMGVKNVSYFFQRGFGTIKQSVFGILCRTGKIYTEIVPDTEAKDWQPLILRQVKKGSTIWSDGWRAYTGLAAKGYLHRLRDDQAKEYSNKKGSHINSLEGFWGYLKRKLAAKGSIRKEKLSIYLGEYVWLFNHRKLPFKEQQKILFKLFKRNYE